MAIIRKRNRLVYFRVSELEFDTFTELCQRVGACNLSELARCALHRMAEAHPAGNSSLDLETLRAQMAALDAKLQHLISIVRRHSPHPENAERNDDEELAIAQKLCADSVSGA